VKHEYFDGPEAYFEKNAGILSDSLKGAWGIAKKPGFYVPAALGLGALGAAGTVGLTGAMEGARPADTLSYRVDRGLHSLYDRIKADEAAGGAFASALGSETAKGLIGLTKDMASKGLDSMKDRLGASPVRRSIFNALKNEDMTLAQADNKTLLEAYHTMAKVAPALSQDKNAVRSFLTTAATAGMGGLDFQTIKGIAEAEAAVNYAKNPGGTRP
jgi:hypothetical protein